MPKKQKFLIILLVASTLFGFSQNGEDLVKFKDGELYGLKDNQGLILVPARYDDVDIYDYIEDPDYNNQLLLECFIVVSGDRKGVFNSRIEKEIIPPKYSLILYKLAAPILVAYDDDTITAFDYNGKSIICFPKISNRGTSSLGVYRNCIIKFEGDNCTFYSLSGEPLDTKAGEVFSMIISNGSIVKNNGNYPIDFFGLYDSYSDSYSLINSYGKLLCDEISYSIFYDNMQVLSDSIIVIMKKSGTEFIDFKGTHLFLSGIDYKKYYEFSDGLSKARNGDKWGYINENGKVVIPFRFDIANTFSNGYAKVMIDDKMGIIDTLGKYIIEPEFDYISSMDNGRYILRKKDAYGLVDEKGKMILPLNFDYISPFCNGIAKTIKGDNVEYVDNNGKYYSSRAKPELYVPSFGEYPGIKDFTFSNSSKYLAHTGGFDFPNIVFLWNLKQKQELYKIEVEKISSAIQVKSLFFSPDDKYLLILASNSQNQSVIIEYNIAAGQLINEFTYPKFEIIANSNNETRSIITNKTGDKIIFSADSKMAIVNFWSGKIIKKYIGFNNRLNISSDNQCFASIQNKFGQNSHINIININKGDIVNDFYASHNGEKFFEAFFDGNKNTINLAYYFNNKLTIKDYDLATKNVSKKEYQLTVPIPQYYNTEYTLTSKAHKILVRDNQRGKNTSFTVSKDLQKASAGKLVISSNGEFLVYQDEAMLSIKFYDNYKKKSAFSFAPRTTYIGDVFFAKNKTAVISNDTAIIFDKNGVRLIDLSKFDTSVFKASNIKAEKEEYILASPVRYYDENGKLIKTSISSFPQYASDYISNDLSFVYLVSENSAEVFNIENSDKIVSIYIIDKKRWIVNTPDNYYMSVNDAYNYVSFDIEGKLFPFEQFDLKYNRPDIVLSRLGYADSTLIEAYHRAYLKRLRKMGFKEKDLNGDFHIPESKIKNFEYLPVTTDSSSIGLNLHFEDNKYKLDRINIWINNVAIYGSKGIDLRAENTNNIDKNIRLELASGKNKIQVSCLNSNGVESYKETAEINFKPKKEIKPNLYLITIGTSKYKDSRFDLQYAAKDANDVANLFNQNKYFGKIITKTLTNEQVTKESIIELKSFLKQSERNDQVIVFVAGHGVLDANLDYYLASNDMDFNHPEKRGIPYEELESILDGIAPLKKILFVDACHSGEIDKDEVELAQAEKIEVGSVTFRSAGAGVVSKNNNLGLKNTSELTKELFTDLRRGTGATVVSSAGGGEYAMESGEWKNGLFTYCLINGIQTKDADLNKDGEIMLSELQMYVQSQVLELSNGKQQPTSRIENITMDFRVW